MTTTNRHTTRFVANIDQTSCSSPCIMSNFCFQHKSDSAFQLDFRSALIRASLRDFKSSKFHSTRLCMTSFSQAKNLRGLIRRSAIEAREQGYRWEIGNYARLPVDRGHLRWSFQNGAVVGALSVDFHSTLLKHLLPLGPLRNKIV